MEKKWYLNSWFISLMFMFSFLIIPGIIGLVLLIKQTIQNKYAAQRYGDIDELEDSISSLDNQISDLKQNISALQRQRDNAMSSVNSLNDEISALEADTICKHYSFSDYDAISSNECKDRLSVLKIQEREAISSSSALTITNSFSKKRTNDNIKQILRCFNSECENVLLNLSVKNIDASRNKITKSFESLNKIYAIDGIKMNQSLLEYKLEELNLVYTYELKKEQEREQQKAIKEQMIEEEKVRKEIEQRKAKLEKDQKQCSNEINKLLSYIQKTQSEVEKQLYIDKIHELEEKLNQLETEKASVLEREANARAGYVYVISNIGSFGENVYKIGMTRRLEPMDRIKELSSASVPFEFDVHAMIFSEDAPALETALHQTFDKKRVNLINSRKEFFRVSLDEIENTVKVNYNNTVSFTKIPIAKEYNETIQILNNMNAS
ncbi:MAG: DUF4041 domain-containing protein [Lachnospiraceae bacterium]|nr:DUF4041 domain-containing protein [Lachnospiraceae bacterium]MBO5144373.1 DUF4041 domain-containing protein [Lachnospiraceae bacterium]